MVIALSISNNFPDVLADLDRLQSDLANVVIARAVNRTMEQARTAMSREIRAEFNLSAAKVREKLFIRKAGFKGGRFTVEAELSSRDPKGRRRSLNVINFSGRQVGKGVAVKIRKGAGAKVIGSAFIANGGRTVFKRTGKARLPIEPVQTIDVPQMFNTRAINQRVQQVILQRFPAVFSREMAYALSRFGKVRR